MNRKRFVIVRGPEVKVNAVVKLVHVRGQWRSLEPVVYLDDQQLAEALHLPRVCEKDTDESPYAAFQSTLTRTRLLVIACGVAQSSTAQTPLLAAVRLRLHLGRDCWLLAPDERPMRRCASFGPELKSTLEQFDTVHIGKAPKAGRAPVPSSIRTTIAKYTGVCAGCDERFSEGDRIAWTERLNGRPLHPWCARPH